MQTIAHDVVDLQIRPQGELRGWLLELLVYVEEKTIHRPWLDLLSLFFVRWHAFELITFYILEIELKTIDNQQM